MQIPQKRTKKLLNQSINILFFYFRGIDVVRDKIKMFAQKKVTLPPGRHKIIILDEADKYVSPFFYFPSFPLFNS